MVSRQWKSRTKRDFSFAITDLIYQCHFSNASPFPNCVHDLDNYKTTFRSSRQPPYLVVGTHLTVLHEHGELHWAKRIRRGSALPRLRTKAAIRPRVSYRYPCAMLLPGHTTSLSACPPVCLPAKGRTTCTQCLTLLTLGTARNAGVMGPSFD